MVASFFDTVGPEGTGSSLGSVEGDAECWRVETEEKGFTSGYEGACEEWEEGRSGEGRGDLGGVEESFRRGRDGDVE